MKEKVTLSLSDSLNKKLVMNCIAFLIFFSQLMGATAFCEKLETSNNVQIEIDGYKFIYQSIPVLHPVSKKTLYYTGRIVTYRLDDGRIIYEENDTLQPGMCDSFSTISKLSFRVSVSKLTGGDPNKNRTFVVLCGSNAGRHQTLKILLPTPGSLKVTSLDFENSRPNISWDQEEGFYRSVVYRRLAFDDIKTFAVTPYLFVYAVYVDNSMFGFVPQFGHSGAWLYLDYYQKLKSTLKHGISSDKIGPIIGSLVATMDKKTICKELQEIRSIGVSILTIREWTKRLVSAGFPYFETKICMEE